MSKRFEKSSKSRLARVPAAGRDTQLVEPQHKERNDCAGLVVDGHQPQMQNPFEKIESV
jgi:hypothetical protein